MKTYYMATVQGSRFIHEDADEAIRGAISHHKDLKSGSHNAYIDEVLSLGATSVLDAFKSGEIISLEPYYNNHDVLNPYYMSKAGGRKRKVEIKRLVRYYMDLGKEEIEVTPVED